MNCACPSHHADDCFRTRYNVDYDEWVEGDRERCEYACHGEYDHDYDADDDCAADALTGERGL